MSKGSFSFGCMISAICWLFGAWNKCTYRPACYTDPSQSRELAQIYVRLIPMPFILCYVLCSKHPFAPRVLVDCCRSYVFRLSAPQSVTTSPASSNGASQKEKGPSKANGAVPNPSSDAGNAPKAPKTSPTMLPPPGGRALKRNGKAVVDRPSDKWAQPKPVVAGGKANSPGSEVDSEQEAMRQANVPISFGAARDKPLGKKADREAHIMRGVPGAVISGASGRFATGRSRGSEKNGKAEQSAEVAVGKEEARRQKQAEIAAITAELVRADADADADAGDAAEGHGGDGDGSGLGSGPPVQFKPGGWRHASGNGKMMMTSGGRKKSQRAGAATEQSRRGEEEEEEEEEPEEEEEEEEMTEEMRIKLVVRRLGLPVSHEVQLSGHRKGVTALASDRAGGRVATGSNDCKVRK